MPRPPRPELMALLADVKQNPDDLTPWLVLCDWLEDRDDEAERARGEYCRLCFDKLGTKTFASDWEGGERRRALYRTHHEAWLGPIGLLRPQVEKGLLTIDSSELPQNLESMKAYPEACAWIGVLRTRMMAKGMMSNRSGLGWLVAGLHTLDLYAPLLDRQVAALAAWKALRSVRSLTIRVPQLTLEQARSLIESPNLTGIRKLVLDRWREREAERSERESVEAAKRLFEAFGERLTIRGGLVTDDWGL